MTRPGAGPTTLRLHVLAALVAVTVAEGARWPGRRLPRRRGSAAEAWRHKGQLRRGARGEEGSGRGQMTAAEEQRREDEDGAQDASAKREKLAKIYGRDGESAGAQLHLQKSKPEWENNEKERGVEFKEQWWAFWYWRPVLFTTGYILFLVDVLFPFLIDKFWESSVRREMLLLTFAAYGAAFVAFCTMNPKAAGVTNVTAVVAMMCTFALAVLAGVTTMYLRAPEPKSSAMLLVADGTKIFRPLLNIMAVVMICQVLVAESGVDWANMAAVVSLAMLGIVLAVTGVIGDILAHLFIRLDGNFHEGDFLIFNDELVEIVSLGWRHTVAIRDTESVLCYIPNNMLTSCSVVNQSKDSDRDITVEIPMKLTGEKLEQAIQNIHNLLQTTSEEGYTFKGSDGNIYKNQFNTEECRVWLKASCDKVVINLVGSYFFSNPPPYEDEGPEPPAVTRQMEREMQWHYQVQWFHLEVKAINEKLGQWPYVNDNQMLLKHGMSVAE